MIPYLMAIKIGTEVPILFTICLKSFIMEAGEFVSRAIQTSDM